MTDSALSRRGFLRLAAGGATLLATGGGCNSGSDKARSGTGATPTADGKDAATLRIAQWNNYAAGYDQWWDGEYTRRWGERNGINVVVDHFDINQASVHAEAEAASQRGHDIFHLNLASPAPFEDQVIDHREIVEEATAKVGKMPSFVERSILNPKTKKYIGFSDFWAANPVHYRTDLWAPIGLRPHSWDDILAAGSRLKAQGHPFGIGMGDDPESNVTLLGLMHGFGASMQDEDANVVINSRATVEAVKVGAAIFRSGMTDEVFGWDITSNNRYLIAGRGSLIVNSVAALRVIEAQDPMLATKIELFPAVAGPAGRFSPYAVSVYFIWKFSPNQEAAKQFLVDLATDYRQPFIRSQFIQMPSYPGAVEDLGELVTSDRAQPSGKYGLLADAAGWMTNIGYPGHFNAASDEVVKASIISQMFAAAARGAMTAAEAVASAEARIKPIYEKWREQGKI